MGTSIVHTLGVRQQNIIPAFPGLVNNTSVFDLSIQHLRQTILPYNYACDFNHHYRTYRSYLQSKYLDYMIMLVLV